MIFKGSILSILASCIFSILYLYSQFLIGDANQVFGWRILITLPFVFVFTYYSRDIQSFFDILKRIKNNPKFILLLFTTSILCSIQLWLFMWGPLNERGLQVSLGYFLLPLVMVLTGRIFFKEKLSHFQLIALLFATLGVSHEIWRIGSIAWETALVAIGYTAYFWLRKKINTNHLGGFIWDLILITPIALIFIFSMDFYILHIPSFLMVMLGFGLLSALGLGCYILSSRFLPFSLFGLLGYLEPILLLCASLYLGESIQQEEYWTYIPIWCALLILAYEGIFHFMKQNKKNQIKQK